jgi:hypothetical protein
MNLADLLALGIAARLDDDGGLLLDAPKGALNNELIERIRQSKPGLIAEIGSAREFGELGELHLVCADPAGEGDTPPIDPAPPIRASRWLLHFADCDPLEVWFAPPATHAAALAGYPDAVAAVPIPERCVVIDLPQSAQQTAQQSASQSAHQSAHQSAGCSSCRHRARPGFADPGYCAMRTDQPKAYGRHHPLHKLPADGGAECGCFAAHQ